MTVSVCGLPVRGGGPVGGCSATCRFETRGGTGIVKIKSHSFFLSSPPTMMNSTSAVQFASTHACSCPSSPTLTLCCSVPEGDVGDLSRPPRSVRISAHPFGHPGNPRQGARLLLGCQKALPHPIPKPNSKYEADGKPRKGFHSSYTFRIPKLELSINSGIAAACRKRAGTLGGERGGACGSEIRAQASTGQSLR